MRKALFNTVQLSAMALAVSQAFAQTPSQDAGTTVVVSGIRASASSAVAIKRDTMPKTSASCPT